MQISVVFEITDILNWNTDICNWNRDISDWIADIGIKNTGISIPIII